MNNRNKSALNTNIERGRPILVASLSRPWCDSAFHKGPNAYLPDHLYTQHLDPSRAKHCCYQCFWREHGEHLGISHSRWQAWTNRQWIEIAVTSREMARYCGELQVDRDRGMKDKARIMWRRLEEALRQGVLRQGLPLNYQEACRQGLDPDIQAWICKHDDKRLYAANRPEEVSAEGGTQLELVMQKFLRSGL